MNKENKKAVFKAVVSVDGRITIPALDKELLQAEPGAVLLIEATNTGKTREVKTRKKRK